MGKSKLKEFKEKAAGKSAPATSSAARSIVSPFALEMQTIVDAAAAGEITRNRVLGERLRDLCARICEKYMI